MYNCFVFLFITEDFENTYFEYLHMCNIDILWNEDQTKQENIFGNCWSYAQYLGLSIAVKIM